MTGGIVEMSTTHYKRRNSALSGEMRAWLREMAGDNREQRARLLRNLRLAREQELSERLQQVIRLYYDCEMTIPCIARELKVAPSTVSRTLKRARERLYRCLRYGL